jgi:hypothetical protein
MGAWISDCDFTVLSSDCRRTLKWSDSPSKEPYRMFVGVAYLENIYAGGRKCIALQHQQEEYRRYVFIV